MSQSVLNDGYRARLRRRFAQDPLTLSPEELLELLLTYAIPRQDVGPQAHALLERFGDIAAVLAASHGDLTAVAGIGDQATTLLALVRQLVQAGPAAGDAVAGGQKPEQLAPGATSVATTHVAVQPALLEVEQDLGPLFAELEDAPEDAMHAFVNDEVANTLALLPQAAGFGTYEDYRSFLRQKLPYNSEFTRQRRANHILARFYPAGRLDTPLTYYAGHCGSEEDLKPAVFYHLAKAEPLLAKVAEELVWPALPLGRIDRPTLRDFVLRHLPEIGVSSQKNTLRSLLTAYELLGVAPRNADTLKLEVHAGTLEGFLYLLTAEFPRPGIYPFEALDNGPLRRWLLWDRDWLRRQVDNLRDLGIIAKVSEIDTLRQFTLAMDQSAALRHFFGDPSRGTHALREQGPG